MLNQANNSSRIYRKTISIGRAPLFSAPFLFENCLTWFYIQYEYDTWFREFSG